MGRRGLVKTYCFLIIVLIIWKSSDGTTMENAKENVNLAAEEVKGKESESMQDAKEMSDSWADWAMEKLAGLGIGMDGNGEEMMHKAGDIAVKTKEQVSGITPGAADKAGEAKDAMMDKAVGYGETIKNKASEVSGSSVESTYEEAKQKVGEAYQAAKDTVRESAKKNYEAAKEKASQATGDLGAHMNQGAEEL